MDFVFGFIIAFNILCGIFFVNYLCHYQALDQFVNFSDRREALRGRHRELVEGDKAISGENFESLLRPKLKISSFFESLLKPF